MVKERIEDCRKLLGMSKEKFDEKIGTGYYSNQGDDTENDIREQTIQAVCREFCISEDWLRNGTGEMLKMESIDDKFAMIVGEIMRSEDTTMKKAIIELWEHQEWKDTFGEDHKKGKFEVFSIN